MPGGVAYAFAFCAGSGWPAAPVSGEPGRRAGQYLRRRVIARARHYGGPYLAFPEAGLEKSDFTVRLVERTGVLSGLDDRAALACSPAAGAA